MVITEVVVVLLLVALVLAQVQADGPSEMVRERINLYVAPDGNDEWSGRFAEPNAERSDGPLCSIVGARDALRALRNELGGITDPVTVHVRGGDYYLDEPVVFGPEDSGSPGCPVTFTAYRDEKPVISGGRIITGWREIEMNGRKMWSVDIPEVKEGKWYFTQLFADGRRLSRTRVPKEGMFRVEELIGIPWDHEWGKGQDEFKYAEGDLKPWRNLSDVEIVAVHFWVESRMPIVSVDEESRTVKLAKKSVFRLSDNHEGRGARYYVENVFEALEEPGQWYLDRSKGVLYYIPLAGEEINGVEFIAPRIPHLLEIRGEKEGENAGYLNFEKLTFTHTQWNLPAKSSGAGQASINVPGALLFERAVFCTIKDCEIAHTANYAVEFVEGCEDNRVAGCLMRDLGAGGIKIGHDSNRTSVEDNEITRGGRIFHSAIGVWIGHSADNRVAHNLIHDFFYTGISVGWIWGYSESKAVRNVIEYNHIHHIGQGMLSDLGGIYTLGISPGTVLRNNLIHDCATHGYGGWGIYNDEGSSYILVENNVVYGTKSGGYHQHYGKDNMIRNNIFAFAKEAQVMRSRAEEHHSFTFDRNIVYWTEGILLGTGSTIGANWEDDKFRLDHNLYWDANGRDIDFAGTPLERWQERGFDRNSLIADPKFADPVGGDFKLAPDSPAFSLGFQPIDLSKVGPRKKPGGGG